jgi:hypothetical protein
MFELVSDEKQGLPRSCITAYTSQSGFLIHGLIQGGPEKLKIQNLGTPGIRDLSSKKKRVDQACVGLRQLTCLFC